MPTSSAKPLSKTEENKADKRRRILEAAMELFAERGFHGTPVPLVAQKAGVGAGTLYRFFENKEAMVNAVFREGKGRLQARLSGLDLQLESRALFDDLWRRLVSFAREEPITFHFLELQDHAPYLDSESRQLELAVLMPLLGACTQLQEHGVFRKELPQAITMALIWGALVGLFKAERNGYIQLDAESIGQARDACWRAFATDLTA